MLSFHVKSLDRQTDGRVDRQTKVKQYAPDLSIQGLKNPIAGAPFILFSANVFKMNKSSTLLFGNGLIVWCLLPLSTLSKYITAASGPINAFLSIISSYQYSAQYMYSFKPTCSFLTK